MKVARKQRHSTFSILHQPDKSKSKDLCIYYSYIMLV